MIAIVGFNPTNKPAVQRVKNWTEKFVISKEMKICLKTEKQNEHANYV